jgi:phosphotransferase system enzyme I (PtsI)
MDTSHVEHGVMFEVPSACLQARKLMKEADFGSIGTNDLIQYLFAVDRNNAKVAYDYSPNREVFWKLVGDIARAADREGKRISVCGELAGDPQYIKKLMNRGIYAVSVSARLVAGARTAAMDVLGRKK